MTATDLSPSRVTVFKLAWPIMIANCAVPLLGLADTAVIGHTGSAAQLGAIALGSLIFNFLYWSFGFLRMGTTGFIAQASGVQDEPEVRATLLRALIVGAVSGVTLVIAQIPIGDAALALLSGPLEVEGLARNYFEIRVWGAPASLATFAVIGALIGLGRSDLLLIIQLFLNGLNIILDILFAGILGMGVAGIALGTALAEWLALLVALLFAIRLFRARHSDDQPFICWPRIFDRQKLLHAFNVNRDILVRTLLMLFGFAWFTNQGAQFGTAVLAANHVLLQFITFSAFLLDGFAHAAEPLIGRAVGTRQKAQFDAALRTSTELAAMTALILSVLIFALGPTAIAALTDIELVQQLARTFLPYAAVYVLFSFAAFQLDGIFIGATWTREMRNASLTSLAIFLAAWWQLAPWFGNHGLWIAMICFVLARALALLAHLPRLRQALGQEP